MILENIDDDTLEFAAQFIEEVSFTDIAGIMARRKRDREDAALRMRTREELRGEMAAHLRAMKSRRDLDAVSVLERIVAQSDRSPNGMDLVGAWPLAWKGWIDIHATVRCNSNCIPPETRYSITLTERGAAVLAKRRAGAAA